MCSNKKYLLILFILNLVLINCFSEPIFNNGKLESYESYKDKVYKKYVQKSYDDLSNDDIAEEYYRNNIPEEFADAFLYYTRDRKEMRLPFYSLMVHESGNFTSYVNINRDGSYDLGPSQLNSNNIKNAKFRKWYNPKDESHITTVYCFYMVMTINYFWDLYNKYGLEYTFYAYNGGEKCVKLIKNNNKDSRYASLISNVKNYDKKVNSNINYYEFELNDFIVNKRINHIVNNYSDCILAELNNYNNIKLHIFEKANAKLNCQSVKLVDNNISYIIRRKNFLKLKNEKFIIVYDPIVDGFRIKIS